MIFNKYIFLFVFMLVFIIVGCNDNPAIPKIDYEPEINVFGLLILNNQQKSIKVERSYKVTEYYPAERGITDAIVTVSSGDLSVFFEHVNDGTYYDLKRQLVLKAGQEYRLDITLSNGHQVSAKCLMPDSPTIISPKDYETVKAYSTLTTEWQAADFAYRYIISVDDFDRQFMFSVYSDSTEENLYQFIFAHPQIYSLKIASMDQNYYDHVKSRSNRDPILHINGALGVFGALAYDRVIFIAE